MADEILAAMLPYFQENFGNPASIYQLGALAGQAVNAARDQVASLLNASTEEIFITSGGTESNNWAIKGIMGSGKRRHVITSAIEHHSVSTVSILSEGHWGTSPPSYPSMNMARLSPRLFGKLSETIRPW